MAANDAWVLQGMNGAVPIASGQTFTGLSRGVFAFGGSTLTLTMTLPGGATATAAFVMVIENYIPGPFTVVAVSGGPAIAYPESTTYTVV